MKNTIIEYSSTLFVTAFVYLNVITLIGIYDIWTSSFLLNRINKAEIYLFAALICSINLAIFNYKKKYKKILKYFKGKYKPKQDYYILLYIALSIMSFYYIGQMERKRYNPKQFDPRKYEPLYEPGLQKPGSIVILAELSNYSHV